MIQKIFATTVLCIAFLLNVYKIPLTLSTTYGIFPWVPSGTDGSSDQIISRSEPFWLYCHTIISLSLVFMSWYCVMNFKRSKLLDNTFTLLHIIFALMIIYNKDNLGKLNVERADIINIVAITLVSIAYYYKFYLGYLAILALPVYLEFFALLKYVFG